MLSGLSKENVYLVRISEDWIDVRTGSIAPQKHITYLKNPSWDGDPYVPQRFRNVAHIGGKTIATLKVKKFEATAKGLGLTMPHVDETVKLSSNMAAYFLDKSWRKKHGYD